jgi:hypothetical protein
MCHGEKSSIQNVLPLSIVDAAARITFRWLHQLCNLNYWVMHPFARVSINI